MKAWLTAAEIAGAALPELPGTRRGIDFIAEREGWQHRPRVGRGGGVEYHVSALPEAARLELARRAMVELADLAPDITSDAAVDRAAEMAGLTGGKRQRAAARSCLLAAFELWNTAAALKLREAEMRFADAWNLGAVEAPDWLKAALPRISASSIGNWRRLSAAHGVGRLAGRHRGRRESSKIDGSPACRDLIIATITHRPHATSYHVMDALRLRLPESALPSRRRLQSWMARWKAENEALFARARDPDAAKGKFRVSFGSANEAVTRINQVWETDATPADVMCADGRHVVIGIIDVATRRAVCLVSKTSKATAASSLLKRAILAWGRPQTLKTDNGKEFTSRHLTGALAALGIAHRPCAPFTPEGKPHIERFFGTMTRRWFESLDGYIGHDVADRQAIRSRESFARRLGEGDASIFNVSLTGAELQRAIDSWLKAVYERQGHEGLGGKSPFETAQAMARGVERITDERALDVLLAEAPGDGWRVVGKKGIRLDRFTYIAPELAGLVGVKVQVRYDATDLGRVVVYDAEGAFVCVAQDPEITGVDRRAIAMAAKARAKEIEAEGRKAIRALQREHRPDTLARELLADAERKAAQVVAFPVAAQPITTPALDAAAEAGRALDDPGAARPRPSYESLTEDERQPRTAEIVALTPREADPFPGWGAEPIDVYAWTQRNPDKTTPEILGRLEAMRGEYEGLDALMPRRATQGR